MSNFAKTLAKQIAGSGYPRYVLGTRKAVEPQVFIAPDIYSKAHAAFQEQGLKEVSLKIGMSNGQFLWLNGTAREGANKVSLTGYWDVAKDMLGSISKVVVGLWAK